MVNTKEMRHSNKNRAHEHINSTRLKQHAQGRQMSVQGGVQSWEDR